MKKTLRRSAAVLISIVMTVLMCALPAFAATGSRGAQSTFKDISRHWAKNYITKAVSLGITSGYSDGTFKPDREITRAEFTRMLNTAIGNNGTKDPGFSDVNKAEWYYNDVCKGVSAAFISGYDDGSFRPSRTITRQETAVILARIVPADGVKKDLSGFRDGKKVDQWAKSSMEKIVGKGYMNGDDTKHLQPLDTLTRAQAVKIIVDMVEGENIITNNQVIIKDNITIKNAIYANRLRVGTDVKDGTSTLDNCTVLGNLDIQGGGSKEGTGVILKNTRIANMNIARGDGTVRVIARDGASVANTDVSESGILQDEGNGGFENVSMDRKADLKIYGDIKSLDMAGRKCDATISKGHRAAAVNVEKDADRSDLTLEEGASASTVNVYADGTAIHGKGMTGTLNVYADSLTYETEPSTVNIDPSVAIRPSMNIDPSEALTIIADPRDGDSDISVTGNIELKFSSVVHVTGSSDKNLTDTQAGSLIQLKKGDSAGPTVPCDVTVNEGGLGVTIDPKGTLAQGEKYYIRIGAGDLTDAYDNTNTLYLTSFTTTGQKQSEVSELNSLEIGNVGADGAVSYSPMSVSLKTGNSYYIGKEKRRINVRIGTLVPDPVIKVSLNSDERKLTGSGGIIEFDLPQGSGDPGTLNIEVSSSNGDYDVTSYSIRIVRIPSDIGSAAVQGTGGEIPLDMFDSLTDAANSNGNSVSFSEISGDEAYMLVNQQELKNTAGLSLKVEKYDKADGSWSEVKTDNGRWLLGARENFGDAGGIYRISSGSKVCGSSPTSGSETETTVKFVKVSFSGE